MNQMQYQGQAGETPEPRPALVAEIHTGQALLSTLESTTTMLERRLAAVLDTEQGVGAPPEVCGNVVDSKLVHDMLALNQRLRAIIERQQNVIDRLHV